MNLFDRVRYSVRTRQAASRRRQTPMAAAKPSVKFHQDPPQRWFALQAAWGKPERVAGSTSVAGVLPDYR
jgi:hypothetical protein